MNRDKFPFMPTPDMSIGGDYGIMNVRLLELDLTGAGARHVWNSIPKQLVGP